jgi:probable HAF family extracellular repeat protein
VPVDLNKLIQVNPAGLFLQLAESMNSRGEIVGFAQTSTLETHAFLATPVHSEVGSESAPPAAQGLSSERTKVALPENVRGLLQQRLRFGPFGARAMGPQ